jgi:Zn-dependent peptidase ImmA (M78 family)
MKNVKNQVATLLADNKIKNVPVDLEKVASKLGLSIEFQPMDGEMSGCLIRNENGGATIGINSHEHSNRQRFTLAHEIAHFILHKGESTFIDRNFYRNSKDGDSVEEMEANDFAAQLLMPEEFLAKDIEDLQKSEDIENGDAIQDLAKKYKVSKQALMFRLASLTPVKAS